MDVLDRLTGPATDLLDRVDELLAHAGAPEEHRIWPLLRRVRALPGEAAGTVAALRPGPLAAAGRAVRQPIPAYDDSAAALTAAVNWTGAAAEAYDTRRNALATRLVGVPETLAGRLAATASYADALADWAERSRTSLARTLADVLGSAEAVEVLVGAADELSPAVALAAAEIGARVLATAADVLAAGEELSARYAPELVELSRPVPDGSGLDGGGGRLDGTTRVLG